MSALRQSGAAGAAVSTGRGIGEEGVELVRERVTGGAEGDVKMSKLEKRL